MCFGAGLGRKSGLLRDKCKADGFILVNLNVTMVIRMYIAQSLYKDNIVESYLM